MSESTETANTTQALINAVKLLAGWEAIAKMAVTELDAAHYSIGAPPICAVCGAADGSWPCTARMVADDLRSALGSDAPDSECHTLPNGECIAPVCKLHGPLGNGS